MALIEPWSTYGQGQGQHQRARSRRHVYTPDAIEETPAGEQNNDGSWQGVLPLTLSSQDWTDILVPRGGSTIWDMNPSKMRTAAIAFTFVSTAGFVTLTAVGGLLAVMLTGALVTFSVLVMVMSSIALIAMVVTGAPIGYAIFRMLLPRWTGPMGHNHDHAEHANTHNGGGFHFPFGGFSGGSGMGGQNENGVQAAGNGMGGFGGMFGSGFGGHGNGHSGGGGQHGGWQGGFANMYGGWHGGHHDDEDE